MSSNNKQLLVLLVSSLWIPLNISSINCQTSQQIGNLLCFYLFLFFCSLYFLCCCPAYSCYTRTTFEAFTTFAYIFHKRNRLDTCMSPNLLSFLNLRKLLKVCCSLVFTRTMTEFVSCGNCDQKLSTSLS